MRPPVAARVRASKPTIPAAIDHALAGALETLATAFAAPAAPPRVAKTTPPPVPRPRAAAIAATPAPLAVQHRDDGDFTLEAPTTMYSRPTSVPAAPSGDRPTEPAPDLRPSRAPVFLGVVLAAAASLAVFFMTSYSSEPSRELLPLPSTVEPLSVPIIEASTAHDAPPPAKHRTRARQTTRGRNAPLPR
jgi:hypothetical protein